MDLWRKIVEGAHGVALREQSVCQVRPDETRSASDQDAILHVSSKKLRSDG